jgi:hypothetical protein
LWRNPLWKNPLPDLVILLSINPADRFTILRELQDLRLPLLNLTTDDLPGNELSTPIGVNPTSTYFYIKIIRFAVLRWQQTYLALKQESHLPDVSSDFILSSQPLIRWRKKAQRKRPFKKLGLLNRIRSTKTLKKNISLKKKSYITRRLSCRPITQLTEFGKNRSPRVGKRNKKKISMCR